MTTQIPRNIKNRIFAIEAAPAAMPVKPNTAATIAITRKRNDQRNIVIDLSLNNVFYLRKVGCFLHQSVIQFLRRVV